MACHRFDGRVGYKGQKYVVVADNPDGSRRPLGWQNKDKIERGSVWKLLAKTYKLKNLRLEPVITRLEISYDDAAMD